MKSALLKRSFLVGLIFILLSGFSTNDRLGFKEVFIEDFYIGSALSLRNINVDNNKVKQVLSKNFNSISPENLLKWQSVHPRPDTYVFESADRYVELGEQLDMFIIGHTLVWHNQTPSWVFENSNGELLDEKVLNKRMEGHIETVMGRYKGRIHGWDVVNEAFTDDGEYRKSNWYNAIGKDFIKQAFKKAKEVDGGAELYYNDYNLWKPQKIDAVIEMVKEMQAEGVHIDGVGMQGHYGLATPTLAQIEASIKKIADQGLKVMITELDIDVLPNPTNRRGADIDDNFDYEPQYDPLKKGIPEEIKQKLAKRYFELFQLFQKYRTDISRVTFWGIRDQDSWLNNWPIVGRTAYPLVFEKDYAIKEEVIKQIEVLKDQDGVMP
ncbi:endo-1,4-beta-xylanase [Echinicola marina]|uniref:endo-1,4-beta-xylanase n=1 Tax=Echinicola marina TaxID=2859768 RepID=UPI001CF67AF0|nr:endo-1,4-beta-xylanase [Echinicola marina]UCS93333.1 endo-1,4-beta-xylanase [Echinicola marina]